jgi:hypothetical protein
LNAPVVMADAPGTIVMSAAVPVGAAGRFEPVPVGVELLHAVASTVTRPLSNGRAKESDRLGGYIRASI